MSKVPIISDEIVVERIYFLRGKKVMLDVDLSEMYGVETKRLNEQVKRNLERFPEDFMFQLTGEEVGNLKSQFATSSWGGRRTLPYAFTEQGVAMLSSVLNSRTAIEVNIRIIRVFTKIREILYNNKEILLKLEQLERKIERQDNRMNKHEKELQIIFSALKGLLTPPTKPRRLIGFQSSSNKQK